MVVAFALIISSMCMTSFVVNYLLRMYDGSIFYFLLSMDGAFFVYLFVKHDVNKLDKSNKISYSFSKNGKRKFQNVVKNLMNVVI